jgi:hypothetical protein
MLPELTEFVPATSMGLQEKCFKVLKAVQDAFFHFFSMLLNGAYASKFETGYWWLLIQLPYEHDHHGPHIVMSPTKSPG